MRLFVHYIGGQVSPSDGVCAFKTWPTVSETRGLLWRTSNGAGPARRGQPIWVRCGCSVFSVTPAASAIPTAMKKAKPLKRRAVRPVRASGSQAMTSDRRGPHGPWNYPACKKPPMRCLQIPVRMPVLAPGRLQVPVSSWSLCHYSTKRRTILKTREQSREAMTRGSFSPGDIRGAPTYTRGLRDCPSAPHTCFDTSVHE